MNRIRISARRLGARAVWLTLGVLMIVLAACSGKSSGDARDLLSTVPADAGAVVVVNVQSLMEKAGFKFKDGKPVPPAQADRWIDSVGDPDMRRALHRLATGDLGMAYEAAVAFVTDQPYVTVLLDDPDRMRAGLDSLLHVTLTERDGVWVGEGWAIKGNQMWAALQYEARPEVINRFAELSEKKSYLSNKVADSLTELSKDFSGVADIPAIIHLATSRRAMSPSQVGMLSMALSALFDNPSHLSLSGDYGKDEQLSLTIGLLNDDYAPAKYLLPVGKVDADAVKAVAPAADIIAAIAVPSKLIDSLEKMASSFGGALPADISELLRPIDGTIVAATDPGKDAFTLTIGTTGDGTSALQNMLATLGSVVREGKTLRVNSGTMEGGAMKSAQFADLLKGTVAGCVVAPVSPDAKPAMVLLRPASGSLEMEIRFSPGATEELIPDAL